jgi:transposase
MRPLSEDLRRRIVEARLTGAGAVEVSARFCVSRRTVARLFGQFERSGELRPKQIGGYRRSRLAQHGRTLERWITGQADLTLTELRERCANELGIRIGLNALWHQLRRLGLSSKKNDARRRAGPA